MLLCFRNWTCMLCKCVCGAQLLACKEKFATSPHSFPYQHGENLKGSSPASGSAQDKGCQGSGYQG